MCKTSAEAQAATQKTTSWISEGGARGLTAGGGSEAQIRNAQRDEWASRRGDSCQVYIYWNINTLHGDMLLQNTS